MVDNQTPDPQIPNQVHVVDSDGNVQLMDVGTAREAIHAGAYRPATPQELQTLSDQQNYGEGAGSALKAFGAGVARGATLDLSDQLLTKSGLTSPETLAKLKEYRPGLSMAGEGVGITGSLLYAPEAEGITAARESLEAAKAAGDTAKIAEATAGLKAAQKTLGHTLTAGDALNPISAVSKIGGQISEAATPFAEGAASLIANPETSPFVHKIVSKALAAGAGSAVEGSVYGLGQAVSEDALGDPDALGEKLFAHLGTGFLLGGGVGSLAGFAGEAIPAAGRKIMDVAPGKSVIKKMLSTLGGVSEADIDAYLANRAAVNSVPEYEDIYNHALDHIEDINQKVSSSALTAEQAQGALKDYQRTIFDDLRDKKYDATIAERVSKQALKDAQETLASKLQEQALGQGKTVAGAMEKLRQTVFEHSAKAYDLLNQSGSVVELEPFFNKGKELADDLRSRGTLESQQMAERLEQYIQGVKDQFGEANVTGQRAKKLIQGLDDVSKYDFNASTFDKGLSKHYKQLRYTLDDALKEAVPAYRDAMKPVAEETRLLRSLEDYGTEEDAVRRLKSIKNTDRYMNEMPLLKQLEEKTGLKFTHDIEPYAKPEIQERMARALPEYHEAQKAAEITQHLRDPRTIREHEAHIQASPEYQKAQAAQAAHDAALAEKERIKGLSPASLEGQLNAAGRGKINPKKILAQLPEYQGKNVAELMELRRLKDAFEKSAMNGSRHVNMYAGILGAIGGALTGHVLGGAGIGAGVGGVMDKYGPQVTKKFLDAYADNASHVAKLASLERAADKTTRLITSSSKAIFSKEISASSLPKVASSDKKINGKDVAKNLSELSNNAERLIDTLDEKSRALYTSAPKTTGALQMAAARATQFLSGKAPKEQQAGPMSRKLPPSQADLSKFNLYFQTVENPTDVLKHVAAGTLTPEHLETLSTVYPTLFSEMKSTVMEHLMDNMAKPEFELPYKKRQALAMFLGQDLDGSLNPQSIQTNQMAMSQMGTQQAKQDMQAQVKVTQGGLKGINAGSRMLTAMQSNSQRENA